MNKIPWTKDYDIYDVSEVIEKAVIHMNVDYTFTPSVPRHRQHM